MNFKKFYYITEVVVPMNISWSQWEKEGEKGMTAQEWAKVNPGSMFRIVKKSNGKTIKGSENKELSDALRMIRAIKVNQRDM